MQFINEDPLFKIVRITGPKHCFLGIEFSHERTDPIVEALNTSDQTHKHLDTSEIIRAVLAGVDSAAAVASKKYLVKKIQYVSSDGAPASAYSELACEIIRRIEQLQSDPQADGKYSVVLERFLSSLHPPSDIQKFHGPRTELLSKLDGAELIVAENAIIRLIEKGEYSEPVFCIYAHPSPRFIEPIRHALEKPMFELFRIEFVHWLYLQGLYPGAERVIQEIIFRKPPCKSDARQAAIRRLAIHRSEENSRVLQTVVSADPDYYLRLEATWALVVMHGGYRDLYEVHESEFPELSVIFKSLKLPEKKAWPLALSSLMAALKAKFKSPDKFIFVDQFEEPSRQDTFVGQVPLGITSSKDLLEAVERSLVFPGYFGCNWNALYDCLRDFEWMPKKTIVLVHRELPHIPEGDLKTYLEILRDASESWQLDEAHELRIVLPTETKSKVIYMLSD